MSFSELWKWIRSWDSDGWVLQVFIIVFVVMVTNFILRLIINRVHRRLQKTRTPWDDAVIDAIRKPLGLLVWVIGITFAAEIIRIETKTAIFSVAAPIRDIGIIVSITWFLLRFIKRAERNIIEHAQKEGREIDLTTADAIVKLLRLSVIITSALVILQTLGISVSGILAFGGIGGIAVGFAARDLLANFFGGLIVYLDRPFSVGDWVRSPDREIEGTIEHIGWRVTRIRTFDKRPLYVPNSVFTTIAVENPSRMTNRRIYETIGIRYDDAGKMREIVARVKAMLHEHPDIDTSKTLIVNFNSFSPSSMDFFIYTFTKTTNWIEYHEVKEDVLLRVIDIIEELGAEIAYPTSTVHVPEPLQLVQQGES